MTNKEPWWDKDEYTLDGFPDPYSDNGTIGWDVEKIVSQAQKRILEKAIERLEDVSGEMEDASYEKAITAIKSLLAEIDT